MLNHLIAAPALPAASPVGAPAMHLVLILTLLFAVVMVRLGRKDP